MQWALDWLRTVWDRLFGTLALDYEASFARSQVVPPERLAPPHPGTPASRA